MKLEMKQLNATLKFAFLLNAQVSLSLE